LADQEQDKGKHPFHREGSDIIFDPPDKKEESAEETRAREQHEFQRTQVKTNQRIAWFTGVLMVFSFLTILVGVWQGTISSRSAKAAQDAADAAQSAVNASYAAIDLQDIQMRQNRINNARSQWQ
jgi:hypothetical protein